MIRFRLACAFLLLLPIACSKARNEDASNSAKKPEKSAEAHFESGIAHAKEQDYDKAITDFTEAIRRNPKNASAYYQRGLAYAEKHEYDKAINDHTEAIRLNPKYADAYFARGSAHADKHELDKAIIDYTEAIRLNPEDANAHNSRAGAYAEKNDSSKAIADYNEAIRLYPEFSVAFSNRGREYERKKEYDKAIADYTEANRLIPRPIPVRIFAFPYSRLAWVLATCPKESVRNGEKAVEHATKACELSTWKYAPCLESLAAAHAENGDFKEAVKWQKKAIELGFSDEDDAKKARQRVKLYEAGKPFRDE